MYQAILTEVSNAVLCECTPLRGKDSLLLSSRVWPGLVTPRRLYSEKKERREEGGRGEQENREERGGGQQKRGGMKRKVKTMRENRIINQKIQVSVSTSHWPSMSSTYCCVTFSSAWCTRLPNTSSLMSTDASTLFSGGATRDLLSCTPGRCSRA